MTRSAVEIASALIRCASVTPDDAGALDYLGDLLGQAGFKTHRLTFSESGAIDIGNLYARFGTADPVLMFAGHTDVVPAGDASKWRFDPFAGCVEEGALWGRGAVDMKGGLAACAAAALEFVATEPFVGSIAFLVTGDEEGPAINGTAKLLRWAAARGERFDHCILAEPTNPNALGEMIKIGRRGSLSGDLVVRGRQGHVGYPHLADNPIPSLVRIVAALLAPLLDQGSSHFEPSNLEMTSIDVGNTARNVIPSEARAAFNIRFNDHWTPQSLSDEISRRVSAAAGFAQVALTFEPTNATSFLTSPGPFVELVSEAIAVEIGRRPALSTSGGTSDARFIKDYCPVVEFGLVGQTMHAVDERTSVADLENLTAIFARVLQAYFA